MRWLLRAASSLVLLMSALCAGAQTYPNKPIRLVVPYPPGGGTDLLARIVGQKLAGALGQPVIVENKPGAGTIIGVEAVAKCAPDGYTLLMATSTTLAINPSVYRKLSYDPGKGLRAGRNGGERTFRAHRQFVGAGTQCGRTGEHDAGQALDLRLRICRKRDDVPSRRGTFPSENRQVT